MKKPYQKPEQALVSVRVVALSSASPSATIDASKSVGAGSIESRRTSFWGVDSED